MSVELWHGQGAVLVDTSAWILARRGPRARELLLAAAERDELAWCWPVRYELTVDAPARSEPPSMPLAVARGRRRALSSEDVLGAMRQLAVEGSHGAHRLPLTDLTVAVAAQTSGLDVLHYDHHFERLGELLGVRMLWISEPSA